MATVAERLDAVVKKYAGKVHGPNGANYEIVTTDGGRLVRVRNADGEVVIGKGKTMAEAVSALEQKLGIGQEAK